MRQLTIHERRQKQLERFNNEYIKDLEKASYLFNSYYRYTSLYRRLVELENDERFHNSKYTKHLQEKEQRIYKKLSENLKQYNISIYVPWITPCLGIKEENDGRIATTVIDPILY